MIVDCFTFYNELELLEIRLQELSGVVDWFVLVEAAETFTGQPKELIFNHERARFESYRICHVKIPRFPAACTSPWEREAYSRNAMMRALRQLELRPDDTILLSDVDEIPSAQSVVDETQARGDAGVCRVFEQRLSYYSVNCVTDEPWHGTRSAPFGSLSSMQALRGAAGHVIPDAGWHFSYLGGPERIREKIAAYSHTEYNRPEYTDDEHLRRCIGDGIDLFGRPIQFRIVPVDYTFPRALVERQDRYAPLIAPVPCGELAGMRRETLSPRDRKTARSHEPARAPAPSLEELYLAAVQSPSDIHEHLPYLARLASTVKHVTELGARRGHSTLAFLKAAPEQLISYDLERSEEIDLLEQAAALRGIRFELRQEDVLTATIEETDLLFIDTWHVEEQMRQELNRHAPKARRYLVLHDTETYGERGETGGHRGIWPAVVEYLREHPEWVLLHHFSNNNGLTMFVRRNERELARDESAAPCQDPVAAEEAMRAEESASSSPDHHGTDDPETDACRNEQKRLRCPLSPALIDLLQACVDRETTHSAELAKTLCRSTETVRTEFVRILKLLGVRSREDAVGVATLCGWVSDSGGRMAMKRQ